MLNLFDGCRHPYLVQVLFWRRGQKNIFSEGIVARLENVVITSLRCTFFICFLEDGY